MEFSTGKGATFYLIRHAATDWIGRAMAGWLPEVHLNETGRHQAERLADELAQTQIHRIFSSPLERARQTAEPISRRLNLPVEIHDALGEVRFGKWTGQSLPELDSRSDWQNYNRFRSGAAVPEGELMVETQTRVVVQLLRWRSELADQRVALVSHADTIKAAVAYFLGTPLDLFHRIEISPASVTILQLTDSSVELLCLNRTQSLPESRVS